MAESIARDKSKTFALRIIRLYKHLYNEKNEYTMSKQLLRCGTSIGANISEAEYSMSKREFIAKMNISLKEAAETEYWLEILHDSEYITDKEYSSIMEDCKEILSLLVSIIKTANENLKK